MFDEQLSYLDRRKPSETLAKTLFSRFPPVICLVATMVLGTEALGSSDDSYFPIQQAGKQGNSVGITPSAARWYSTSLKRMREPKLPRAAENSQSRIYRLLILPTWGNPVCVRVERRGDVFSLCAKRLNGQGGYNPGKLVEKVSRVLTREDSNTLSSLLLSVNPFGISTEDEDVYGSDGDQWVFECVEGGRYHVVNRWSPTLVHGRHLERLVEVGKFLVNKSNLTARPTNRGQEIF